MAIEAIDQKVCDACGICIDSCPVDVLRMDEEGINVKIAYPEDCVACYLCEVDCPKDAIKVSPDLEFPVLPY